MTTTLEEPSESTPKPKTPSKYSVSFPYDLVAVWWEDAHSSDSWKEISDLDLEECIAITVGFKFKENEHRILIADSIIIEDGKITHLSNTTTIPQGMVRQIKLIKKGKG